MVSSRPGTGKSRDRWWWLIGRVVIILLFLLAMALLLVNKAAPDAARGVRGAALDAAAPVLDAAGAPVRATQTAGEWLRSYFNARDRASNLEREVARLRTVADENRTLDAENRRLKALLKVTEPEVTVIGVARVVGASAGSSLMSAIITRGSSRGVRIGQPVRDPDGLVGRVIEAGRDSARLLLVTDVNSNVPVRVERTGHAGLASGVNGRFMHLLYVEPDAELRIGDRLVTSGQGGVFPPGIAVGTIASLGKGDPLLKPAAQMAGLDYVLVLRSYVEPLPAPVPQPSSQAQADEARVAAAAAPR